MAKCSEGTYRRPNGTYFTVKSSDLWDQCKKCRGYHPNEAHFCKREKKKTWWTNILTWPLTLKGETMGVLYYVACEDCKVIRDLDKFYTMLGGPHHRQEAKQFAKAIRNDAFRAGLLVGFMGAHRGHTCRIIDDLDPTFTKYGDYQEESKQFWSPQ